MTAFRPSGFTRYVHLPLQRRFTWMYAHAGPKTVFFWAPMMKWCLVAAGLKDLSRPADKLSVSQNLGAFNYSLFCVELTDEGACVVDFALSPSICPLWRLPSVLFCSAALAATGFIWVRYSFVITPINVSLAAVNFFVGSTGLGQLARIWHYQRTQDDPVARYFGTAGLATKDKSEASPKTTA
uniref:Mitochondrial pyruvate carrier n=1 Tax=Ganoderma boninense TaxID=34458 RepID=A0A5K1JUF8_9APHY|nr:Calcium-transporting ATPase (EC [Ganoderma boninense]